MTDEVASAVLSGSTKTLEAALEIIRMLAPGAKAFLSKVFKLGKFGVEKIGEGVDKAISKGAISRARLIVEADKARSPILSNSNFLARDAELIAQKAAQYKIPISIVGEGEKQTITFLERDKDVMSQITQEIMEERLKGAPESVKSFSVSQNTAAAIKSLYEENGVECQLVADGEKIKCVYPAEYAEKAEALRADYKQIHKEVADNFSVQRDEKGISVTDDELGKTIPLTPLNKEQVSKSLQDNFSYSKTKADLAANKLCKELGLDEKKFNVNPQTENLNSLKTNIRYPSDDISIRDMRFDAVNFKDGENTHILIQNGEKSAALTPETMSKTEMKNICKEKLGMSEQQAELAVEKAVKVDSQIKSKISERTIDSKGLSQEMHIERTSAKTFTVQLGDKVKAYNANTINLDDKIARDFGIPKENARNVINKAQKQSLLQNKLRKSAVEKKAAAPKIELGKGKKR